ncbi:MAG: tetratricopeptide repeat protein [Prevotellaceae bacterium]|jgi:tetratricopeptide (TPR) repeat protein|nr:tetratricopeptide repeat protein [Prevotellaceae bacterium]
MKKTIFIAVLAVAATFVSAQNLGVDYFLLGDYDAATAYFQKKLSSDAAEANFYLGEIAFKKGNLAEAKTYYENGAAANSADPYNKIGLVKLQIKGGNAKIIDKELQAIQKLAKKDVYVAITIARAYLDNGDVANATLKHEAAKKINKKVPQIYILAGDIVKASGGVDKLGAAAAQYEMSNTIDPNYTLGYLKSAQIYETLNPRLALELLEKDTELNPNYLLAYRDLGKVSVTNGRYPEAIEAYTKFFNGGGDVTVADIERFARAYYFTDNYPEAQKLVNQGLAINPNAYVLNRFNMYIAAKQKNTEAGLPAAEKFFAIPYETPHLPLDYSEYAILLLANNNVQQAFAAYDKGISIDTLAFENPTTRTTVGKQRIDLMTLASTAAKGQKNYALAADYHTQYMAATNSNSLLDFTNLALNYLYAAANTDTLLLPSLQKNEKLLGKIASSPAEKELLATDLQAFSQKFASYYFQQANEYSDSIIARSDTSSYTGHLLKAQIANTMNPKVEEGPATHYYEIVVDKITNRTDSELSAKTKQILLEAYNYLGYYYFLIKDKTNSINYWNKVVELDPNNANAKVIFDAYAKQK